MSHSSRQPLSGMTVGIYLAPTGTEEIEFTEPKSAVNAAGAVVHVLSSESSAGKTVNNDLEEGDAYPVDRTFHEVTADDYDALIIPGGTVGADRLRLERAAIDLLSEHVRNDKPVGAICHGPWLLIEAGVVAGRRLTSYRSLETDIRNAGGKWFDEAVVRDDGIVTSRSPDDLEAFCNGIIDEFAAVPAEG